MQGKTNETEQGFCVASLDKFVLRQHVAPVPAVCCAGICKIAEYFDLPKEQQEMT